jgi:hypothetical protein
MNLIREVLDNQLVDRNRRRLGKIDGIVAEFRPGRPPRLKCIETGWSAKARRIHPRLAEWIRRWASAPFRIEWKAIRDVGVDVEVALEARETPLLRTENRLRRFLTRIPGS